MSYILSEMADQQLSNLYRWGLEQFGQTQADRYYFKLIEHFDSIAAAPRRYPRVDNIRPGYRRSVCGRESIYFR